MQITIPRGELKEAVAGFSKIVNGKSRTLPVLGCVRFQRTAYGITGSVTGLDQHLRFTFAGAQANGDGSFILPLASLKELTQGKADDAIAFETGKDNAVLVTNNVSGHAVRHPVSGMDPEEWPAGPADVPTQPAAGFLETYRKLAPFASEDTTRYVLNSVYVDTDGKGDKPMTLVACDGRRMTCQNSMALPIAHPTIVPVTKFLSWTGLQGDAGIGLRTVLEKAKKNEEDRVRVLGFVLSAGPWYFDCKAVDGQYPNWRQVIPPAEDMDNRIVFTDEDIAALRQILPTFPGANTNSRMIALRPGSDGKLAIGGQGVNDKSETRLELTGGSTFEGKLPGIGVNAFFLLDALATGFRSFAVRDELCPLRAEDGHGGIHVLMPMKLWPEPPKPPPPESVPAETKPEPGPEQAHEDVKTTPALETPVEPTKKEDKTMTKEANGTTEDGTALDRLQSAYEVAKAKVKDAHQALADLAVAIRDAVKENKQLKSDVENVRAGLAKLQSIKV